MFSIQCSLDWGTTIIVFQSFEVKDICIFQIYFISINLGNFLNIFSTKFLNFYPLFIYAVLITPHIRFFC